MTAECKSGSPSFHPRQEDVESKIVSGFFSVSLLLVVCSTHSSGGRSGLLA